MSSRRGSKSENVIIEFMEKNRNIFIENIITVTSQTASFEIDRIGDVTITILQFISG